MIITKKDLILLYQIEVHCEKCIRACVYADVVIGSTDNMWTFTQNCYSESAILHWCKVFGSYKEPTHYTHFFKGKCFSLLDGSHLTEDHVRKRIHLAANMKADEYDLFWKNLKKGRDQYFVHNDFGVLSRPTFPDTGILKAVALEMRDVIHDVVSNEESADAETLKLFRNLVQWNRNRKYLQELASDCARFKSLLVTEAEAEPVNSADPKGRAAD